MNAFAFRKQIKRIKRGKKRKMKKKEIIERAPIFIVMFYLKMYRLKPNLFSGKNEKNVDMRNQCQQALAN